MNGASSRTKVIKKRKLNKGNGATDPIGSLLGGRARTNPIGSRGT